MNKQHRILIPLLAISVVFLLGYEGLGWKNSSKEREIMPTIVSLSIPDLSHPLLNEPKVEAWTIFKNYLEFARAHNLAGVKSLSYQISATCSDPIQTAECFALMDSVYEITKDFKQSDFKYIEEDSRQIVMSTDGPVVAILFFTKDLEGTPKMLGLRFCFEDETVQEKCIETDSIRHDEDGDGWWDSVESLFFN